MEFSQQLAKLDRAVALERLGGDEQLLQEVARLFLDEYPSLMSDIEAAKDSRNAKLLERAAHSLKGSVANFGADQAVEASLRLEKMGRGGNLQGVDEAYEILNSVMKGIHHELEDLAGEFA